MLVYNACGCHRSGFVVFDFGYGAVLWRSHGVFFAVLYCLIDWRTNGCPFNYSIDGHNDVNVCSPRESSRVYFSRSSHHSVFFRGITLASSLAMAGGLARPFKRASSPEALFTHGTQMLNRFQSTLSDLSPINFTAIGKPQRGPRKYRNIHLQPSKSPSLPIIQLSLILIPKLHCYIDKLH